MAKIKIQKAVKFLEYIIEDDGDDPEDDGLYWCWFRESEKEKNSGIMFEIADVDTIIEALKQFKELHKDTKSICKDAKCRKK